ncbi:MAG: hypothetical protein ACR2LN_01990 [Candidatus Levyibacteriota bacterium]
MKKFMLKIVDRTGYTISNIKEALDEKNFAVFAKWMSGQTAGIYKGESIVYRHDFERFLKGLPPLD